VQPIWTASKPLSVLDVGLSPNLDVLDQRDLDNYVYPVAARLKDDDLVSVWCTKQHNEQSFVRIEAAREIPAPVDGRVSRKNDSVLGGSRGPKQIHVALAGATELPAGPVSLELAFVVDGRSH
jgi:hypothetical protein